MDTMYVLEVPSKKTKKKRKYGVCLERVCVYGLGDRLGVEAGKSESVLAIVLDEL